MYHTYIIYSKSIDRYYIGHTSVEPTKRLERHNDGWTRSTRQGIPWTLVYLRTYDSKSEAIQRERFIKKQKSRDFIERLIGPEENEIEM